MVSVLILILAMLLIMLVSGCMSASEYVGHIENKTTDIVNKTISWWQE